MQSTQALIEQKLPPLKKNKDENGMKNNCMDISSDKQTKLRKLGHGKEREILIEKLNPF